MGVYGESAIRALNLVTGGKSLAPADAWDQAIRSLTDNVLLMKKGCPRSTFLGLCEEGLVRGIPAGNYTSSVTNKINAVRAVAVLKNDPAIDNPVDLARRVAVRGISDNQMDVVLALWKHGAIR